MLLAVTLALLPVVIVAAMVIRDRRPGARGEADSIAPRAESNQNPDTSVFSDSVAATVEAYAAYLNTPRGIFDAEEQRLFEEDLAKARAAMERAWLEAMP